MARRARWGCLMFREKPRPSKFMIAQARRLRRASSFPQRLLWSRLRNGRCGGLKFRRQHPVGRYVADFFCASAGVVVELDGRSHDGQASADAQRQLFLEQQGLTVIRISIDRLLQDLDGVVEGIAQACSPSPGPSDHPLPEGEE